jgi:hypothetical protein
LQRGKTDIVPNSSEMGKREREEERAAAAPGGDGDDDGEAVERVESKKGGTPAAKTPVKGKVEGGKARGGAGADPKGGGGGDGEEPAKKKKKLGKKEREKLKALKASGLDPEAAKKAVEEAKKRWGSPRHLGRQVCFQNGPFHERKSKGEGWMESRKRCEENRGGGQNWSRAGASAVMLRQIQLGNVLGFAGCHVQCFTDHPWPEPLETIRSKSHPVPSIRQQMFESNPVDFPLQVYSICGEFVV